MPGLTGRPLAEIIAAAVLADCGECWPGSGNPCAVPGGGVHLARIARAYRKGVLSSEDVDSVMAGREVFGSATVIRAETTGVPA